jgi:hypothetical protein
VGDLSRRHPDQPRRRPSPLGLQLNQFITDYTADLTAKNITPGPLNTSIANAKTDAVQKETAQEAKESTAAYDASAKSLYDLLTSVIDVCAGALGKQVLAIRQQLNKRRGGGGSVNSGTSGSP